MAEAKEQEFVHEVYNEIASHFSQTRYKPWPIVTKYLENQQTGGIGIDVGCGNGKYLDVNPNVFMIGSDRSWRLVEHAHERNTHCNVLVADGLHLPHRDNSFDFAISIAVVHHWSTRERRVEAIAHILSKVKPAGTALIYCWALEQASSRRGYQAGQEQDVLVPWVLQGPHAKTTTTPSARSKAQKTRPKGPDLTHVPPQERAAVVAQWKLEQEANRAKQEQEQQEQVQSTTTLQKDPESELQNTKYRYYHLYKEGELEEDCASAGGQVIEAGYERDNWYVIVQRQ
ncbi:LAME_0G14180g1_1 [Lachancea meyersii CBS 8951]|uniref:LAME_0G14180g1_1 n=1 Tax=Lachancea meyersii CBS 8951 TaxID=1266667 RepID=A0A1G4KAB9_9SACH|nr:LAME_0G14180g1_1 [Lachancea meyersii CBS 8951]